MDPSRELKELITSYTIIEAKSRAEALEWTKRGYALGGKDGEIEVRQFFELDDFIGARSWTIFASWKKQRPTSPAGNLFTSSMRRCHADPALSVL